MQTSDKGGAFLERQEGVVLRAYRDPVGVWTIGAGLTKASGVVVPKAGMVIARAEASRLLQRALKNNYEPAVNAAMPGAQQHEFDGGVSFHFNTGAIRRASWVRKWLVRDMSGVRRGLLMWVKGSGKVLPGLKRRREEEFALIRNGYYSVAAPPSAVVGLATFAVPYDASEIATLSSSLRKLGYDPGSDSQGIARTAIQKFQKDHALAVDGVIGRATLSTVQRRLDARIKSTSAAGISSAAAVDTQTGSSQNLLDGLPLAGWAGWIVLGLGLLYLGWLAFSYRDALAFKLQTRAPFLARFLRSF